MGLCMLLEKSLLEDLVDNCYLVEKDYLMKRKILPEHIF